LTGKKKLQEEYVKLQYIYEQIKEIENQNQLFSGQIAGLALTSQNLDDFKEVKKSSEILVPLSQGIYAKAELKENDPLLINVGSGVAVSKSIEDTKKMIDSQITEIKRIQERMVLNLHNLSQQALAAEKEINRISSESK